MRLPTPLAFVLLLAGCAPIVALEPADDAANRACAEVIVGLPDTVDGLAARETNSQGTGAWGEPAAVTLRCGVPPPGPNAELPCYTQDGVDWILDDSNDPVLVAITYGREPAVEVIIDNRANGVVLSELAAAVSVLPVTAACIGMQDVSEVSPAPTRSARR